jgi:hypothetical protein
MPGCTWIVDTNVILVAGGQHHDVSDACVVACAERLETIMKNGRLALDSGYEIVGEYLHRNEPNRGKNPGDVFAKWVLRNRSNVERCDLVDIPRGPDGDYASFPKHPDLMNFDPPDKKFVAVAAAHRDKPTILEAADSKWIDWETALNFHGINVEFICLADIKKFHKKKFGT